MLGSGLPIFLLGVGVVAMVGGRVVGRGVVLGTAGKGTPIFCRGAVLGAAGRGLPILCCWVVLGTAGMGLPNEVL